ncbi:hypothetical protein CN540_28270 [Bacillus toyonensis]|uniref:type III toxin-antitoxin system CptIN family toxin n=1 Tax=Bacillus toyonensis TaxID=155322 RepID=UPI000BF1CCE0|nr:hypothetical protein [Bacillus toyonensis]PEN47029.1 hypothetical protein CN540_28270 [Bacillus toyonensis]
MAACEYGFYMIDDQFFKDFPDGNLKGNKKQNRPHYYSFKEEKTGIMWVIPMSHQVEKYEKLVSEKVKRFGKCDTIHIMEIAGEKSVFLLQDMFPIVEKYILREYVIKGIPLKLRNNNDIKTLDKKARFVYSMLIHKNKQFTPTSPDVKKIYESLKASQTV